MEKPLTSIGAIAHKESIDDHSEQSEQSKPKTIDDHQRPLADINVQKPREAQKTAQEAKSHEPTHSVRSTQH